MLTDFNAPTAARDRSALSRILLIRPDINATTFRDAVLKQFGFLVEVAIPTEVPSIVNDDIAPYAVVVIGDALPLEEVEEISVRLRQYSPQSKIILMAGPHSIDVDRSLFDAMVDTWSGPQAFIGAVQRLIAS